MFMYGELKLLSYFEFSYLQNNRAIIINIQHLFTNKSFVLKEWYQDFMCPEKIIINFNLQICKKNSILIQQTYQNNWS